MFQNGPKWFKEKKKISIWPWLGPLILVLVVVIVAHTKEKLLRFKVFFANMFHYGPKWFKEKKKISIRPWLRPLILVLVVVVAHTKEKLSRF